MVTRLKLLSEKPSYMYQQLLEETKHVFAIESYYIISIFRFSSNQHKMPCNTSSFPRHFAGAGRLAAEAAAIQTILA